MRIALACKPSYVANRLRSIQSNMSRLPIHYGDSMMHPMRPMRILDQHFGLPLNEEDFLAPFTIPSEFRRMVAHPGYYRPWRSVAGHTDTGSTVSLEKDKFLVNLDVQQFKPEEVTVKVTGNNQITIEGKHEEKEDEHGYISRHFVRKYVIPEGHDMDKIVSRLSSDGVLSITAPKVEDNAVEHREIPIHQTGTPAIKKTNGKK